MKLYFREAVEIGQPARPWRETRLLRRRPEEDVTVGAEWRKIKELYLKCNKPACCVACRKPRVWNFAFHAVQSRQLCHVVMLCPDCRRELNLLVAADPQAFLSVTLGFIIKKAKRAGFVGDPLPRTYRHDRPS